MPYNYRGNPEVDVIKIKQKPDSRLLEELKKFIAKDIMEILDIPKLLEGYRKKTFSSADLNDLSVIRNFGIDYDMDGFTSNPVFMNVPYHLFLRKKEKVIAVVGFEPHTSAILIAQIQNSRNCAEELRPLKWSNGLVKITLEWTKQMGIPEVWLLPRERNCSYSVRERLPRTQAFYDKTALQEGFVYDPEMQVFRTRH